MRYDPAHKQQTRDRVLTEAAAAIRADGPERIGVAAVMARAGLTHGGFYAHFASKDELIAAAIDRMFEDVREMFVSRARAKPADEALAAYIDAYLSPQHRDRRTCPLPLLAADVPRLGEATRRRYAAGVLGLTAALAKPIEALGRPDAPALAASVVAELIGCMALARAVAAADRAQSDRMLAASRGALKARLGLPAGPAAASPNTTAKDDAS